MKAKELYFTIDLRSLGLFRILFAILLIFDSLVRWPNLEAFYTSFGVLPIESPLPKAGGDFHFSLLDSFTSLPMVKLFFIIGLVCYLFFLFGYRTKFFQVFSFFIFISILNRNILVRDGSDCVMVSLFFWSLFLPVGKWFSIDAILEKLRVDLPPETMQAQKEKNHVGKRSDSAIAAFAIMAQIGIVYIATAITKNGLTWKDGTALYYALLNNQFGSGPLSHLVLSLPFGVLKMMTWGTLGLEYAALFLLLSPFGQPWLRRVCVLSCIALHLGIFTFMNVGHFPLIMIASMVLFLGEEDWKWIGRWSLKWSKPLTVYYDDTCGFCTKCCQLLAIADVGKKLTFIGNTDEDRFKHDLKRTQLDRSIVVFDDKSKQKRDRAEGVATIFASLPFPLLLFKGIAVPPLKYLSDFVYDKVAENRQKISMWMGMKACGVKTLNASTGAISSMNPSQNQYSLSKRFFFVVENFFVAVCFIAILWDCYDLSIAPSLNLRTFLEPTPIEAFIQSTQLLQDWHMFSSNPSIDCGWWVIKGKTESGEILDPLTGLQPDFNLHYDVPKQFDRFWRKYLYRIWLRDYSDYRLYLGKYITRRNHREMPVGHRLKEFDLYYVLQNILPPGSPKPFPYEPILLWHHECFAK